MGYRQPIDQALATYHADTTRRAKNLDEVFADRGFTTVDAEVRTYKEVFGAQSYGALFHAPGSSERIIAEKAASEYWSRLLAAETDKSLRESGLYASVVHNSVLDCFTKLNFCRRFFPEELYQSLSPYFEEFDQARISEFTNLCRLYPMPPIDLMDGRTHKERKAIYCEVMDDAFGALGFRAAGKRQGVNHYSKKVTSTLSVNLSADPKMFLTDFAGVRGADGLLAINLPYDQACKFSLRCDVDEFVDICSFDIAFWSVASSRLRRYRNSCSLETTIRADALWYETIVMPFEEMAVSALA